jgi:hypothetical protein
VFDIAVDKEAKSIYNSLKVLKERTRNPQAHGGFEKGWQSLYFHMPKIGALPGNLMDFNQSSEFKFIPIEHKDYEDMVKLLDSIDTFIADRLPLASRYVTETALPVAFDSDSRAEYRAALIDEATFAEYLDVTIHVADMHANMDY